MQACARSLARSCVHLQKSPRMMRSRFTKLLISLHRQKPHESHLQALATRCKPVQDNGQKNAGPDCGPTNHHQEEFGRHPARGRRRTGPAAPARRVSCGAAPCWSPPCLVRYQLTDLVAPQLGHVIPPLIHRAAGNLEFARQRRLARQPQRSKYGFDLHAAMVSMLTDDCQA